MSHFYGSLRGAGEEVTRRGHRSSGMRVIAASYSGCVDTQLSFNASLGVDMASVEIRPWQGNGVSLVLYEGPICPKVPTDIDKAFRCRTCVNHGHWTPIGKEEGATIIG